LRNIGAGILLALVFGLVLFDLLRRIFG